MPRCPVRDFGDSLDDGTAAGAWNGFDALESPMGNRCGPAFDSRHVHKGNVSPTGRCEQVTFPGSITQAAALNPGGA